MEFIKKHYEKLILLFLLLTFIAVMFHVLAIVRDTKEITNEDLNIPTREADYQPKDVNDPEFNVAERFKSTSLSWINPGPRAPENAMNYSDLTYMSPLVQCPFCSKIISRQYMEEGSLCPFCKNANNNGKEFVKVPELGTDGPVMRIPDEIKLSLGLPLNDPNVEFYDLDGDGFSNLYEYMMKTKLEDQRSHPPLWRRLQVVNIGPVLLPLKFRKIETFDSDNPEQWEVQINSSFYSIGQFIAIDRIDFRIERAENRPDAPDGQPKAILYLKEVDGDREITMVPDGDVYSPDEKIQFSDSLRPGQIITTAVGQTIQLGTRQTTGVENYRIKEVNKETVTVILENPNVYEGDATIDAMGERMEVNSMGHIPMHLRVRKQVTPQGEGEYGPYPPENPRY